MFRARSAVFAAVALCAAAGADDKPKPAADPVAAELAKAKADHEAAADKAAKKLLEAFPAEKARLEADTKRKIEDQIKLIERLDAERAAFAADPTQVPKSDGLKPAVADYLARVWAAKKPCDAAFAKAADAYRKGRNLPAAKAVLRDRDEFFKKYPLTPGEVQQTLVGTWVVTTGDYRSEWTFKENGTALQQKATVAGRPLPSFAGRWTTELDQKRVLVKWANGAVDQLDLPLDPKATPVSAVGRDVKLEAVKK